MRNETGFDLWAGGYDASVIECDKRGEYPFAGYKSIMNTIFERVTARKGAKTLDVGIGTGFLSSKLAEAGCEVWGLDFSEEMLRLSRERIPNARLFKADFSEPLPTDITDERFDFIISTYALHHLTDERKAEFVRRNATLLAENGEMIIGDVSFDDRADLDKCRIEAGEDNFDDDEFYWIADEILPRLDGASYERLSRCAGIYTVRNASKAE